MSDRYEKWREKAEKHDLNHTTVKRNGQKDFSCTKCHQPSEIMRKEFRRFWKWYKEEIPEVRSYSGKAEENFEELMKEDFSVKERTGTEKAKIRNKLIWLIESMRYDKSPEKMTKEIIETVLGMIAASNKFTKKGKAAKELYREYLTSGSEGYNMDNRGGSEKMEKDMSEESGKLETYDRKEDDDIITIYVNSEGIFRVTGTGKEIRIRVDTEDLGNKLSGREVTELCNKTEEEMEPVFEEVDKIIRELREEKDEVTLLEELKNNTEETYNKKGKERETYEDEITEFEDPVENIINMGDFGIPKISDSEKDSEKGFEESEEESQELESEEVEDYSESESEEELVIVNPPVNMALNIIQVESFNGENIDAERWLQKFTRAAAVNNWVGNARVEFAAAKLDRSAAEWFEKDQELPDANGGRINAWDDQTDVNIIARSFVTKFKEEFISEEAKREKKREWYFQWRRVKQSSGESIDAYTKRYQKLVRNAEKEITEDEKKTVYQEGLLPMYYANAIVMTSANVAEAIRNAKNSERGILRQMFPEQRQEQSNKIYQEIQKKDIKSEEIDDLTKMMKEMKIQLMKSFNGGNSYEKRDRGYNNSNRREITCYR